MNRLVGIGSLSIVVGFLLVVIKMLARLMPGEPGRFDYTWTTLLGPERVAWIDPMGGSGFHALASWFVTSPLYIHCFAVGAILLLVSGFRKG